MANVKATTTITATASNSNSNSNSTLRIWFVVVGIWMFYISQQARLFLDHHEQINVVQVQNANANVLFDATRLIFLISMGEQAKESKLVERFVWSARHRGEWNGYILLLTDAPLERYQDFSKRLLVMNPAPGDLDKRFKDDMPYKRFKTMIIDYIDKDKRLDDVELIYYLDVDNIVGNSLPNMFHDLETKYNVPSSSSSSSSNPKWLRSIPRIWFFANKYTHLSVQGGQFIVDRYSSGPCLQAWRDKIDANVSEPKDQPALHKIRGNGRNQDCQIVTMLPKSHIYFPSNSTIHRDAKRIQEGKKLTYQTLVHIKNSCNTTASIDARVEELYVQDIVRNQEFSKKIHIQPDQ